MMVIRHLQYLTALARERHFARAAAVCNVTQPTLSAGIKQLEESLGVLIVERGQRFLGLTAEGERVLAWAQRVLVDYGSLQQELSEMREGLVGQLRIGAIPVTLPIVPLLTAPFAKRHERTDILVISQTSIHPARPRRVQPGCRRDLSRQRTARSGPMPAALSGALCAADAARRPVSQAQRRHVDGGSNLAVMPFDPRHAKPPYPRYALSRRRRRNSCRRRDELACDPLVPSAPRSLVERRAAHL